MKDLIKRHHAAIWMRGFIKADTTIQDFIDKLDEEVAELKEAHEINQKTDPVKNVTDEMAQELIDIMAVCTNCLLFYGFNIEREFRINTETQEERIC